MAVVSQGPKNSKAKNDRQCTVLHPVLQKETTAPKLQRYHRSWKQLSFEVEVLFKKIIRNNSPVGAQNMLKIKKFLDKAQSNSICTEKHESVSGKWLRCLVDPLHNADINVPVGSCMESRQQLKFPETDHHSCEHAMIAAQRKRNGIK